MTLTSTLTMASSQPFPLLTSLVVLPFIGAALIGILPTKRAESMRMVALATSIATAAVAAFILADFNTADAGFQYVTNQPWVESLGISWHLGVDGISLFLVALTAVIFPVSILVTKPEHESKAYYAWLMLLLAGSMGVFLALDLFMFFIFFEIVLVPMYFLIGNWGHGDRIYAAMKFFLYTMAGSAFLLVGILTTVFLHAQATGGAITFDLVEIATSQSIATTSARWLFLAFSVAFAVKVPLFPVHTWLPDAHTNAPTAGSVILAALLLKFGTYGFVRFGLFLFPEAAVYFAPVFLTLGVIGILYGAVVATMQKDLKRLIAYSSIAHLGFIALGVFALNTIGIEGGVLQMVNHGLSTGALFILVGWIYERRHTRIMAELGGIQRVAPIFAGVFTLVMFSSIGVPGLNGFIGEYLVLIGSFASARWWAVAGTAGVIIAAVYLLWAYQQVFHGTPNEENAKFKELSWAEGLAILPLLALIVFLGVYPKPVLERIEPAARVLVQHIETEVPRFTANEGAILNTSIASAEVTK
ncbi:MAG: NADH-quinone oxidoreductase subunit M [Acidimicrobiia bacterium]